MSKTVQPHDRFCRILLEQPKAAAALLHERLPEEIAQMLSPEPPQLVEGTFIDQELRLSQSDRLFRVRLRGDRPGYVYCLIEHKSAPEAGIALQLLRYLTMIWQRLAREAGPKGLLPPIFPLVIYQGIERWRVPLDFQGIIDADESVKGHLLNFRYGLVELGRIPDGKALEGAHSSGRPLGPQAHLARSRRAGRARGVGGSPASSRAARVGFSRSGLRLYHERVPARSGGIRGGRATKHVGAGGEDGVESCSGMAGRGAGGRQVGILAEAPRAAVRAPFGGATRSASYRSPRRSRSLVRPRARRRLYRGSVRRDPLTLGHGRSMSSGLLGPRSRVPLGCFDSQVDPEGRAAFEEAVRRSMSVQEAKMVSKAVQEWRAEGRAEGKLEDLRKLLERRFGPLSEERCEALRTARLADLDLWFDRALDVASIEEVFVEIH